MINYTRDTGLRLIEVFRACDAVRLQYFSAHEEERDIRLRTPQALLRAIQRATNPHEQDGNIRRYDKIASLGLSLVLLDREQARQAQIFLADHGTASRLSFSEDFADSTTPFPQASQNGPSLNQLKTSFMNCSQDWGQFRLAVHDPVVSSPAGTEPSGGTARIFSFPACNRLNLLG